jgi:tetratricopeptide (TPR) repeat protein
MIRAEPSNVTLHNDVAVMYDEVGRPDQAALHFEMVQKLQPDSAPAHYNFGTALSATRRWQEAIEQYQHALRLQSNYALAHNNLGHALLQIGKPAEALAHFREASQLDPGNANNHSNVATVLRALGAFADAIDELRQAVRLAPNAAGDLNSLAWLLATTPSSQLRGVRDANEAIRLAEHAAELTDHQRPSILDTLAAAQAAAGRFDLAVTTCEAALALKPSATVDAAIRQREALYRQGRPFVMPARTP